MTLRKNSSTKKNSLSRNFSTFVRKSRDHCTPFTVNSSVLQTELGFRKTNCSNCSAWFFLKHPPFGDQPFKHPPVRIAETQL